jgi:hypothetical protein
VIAGIWSDPADRVAFVTIFVRLAVGRDVKAGVIDHVPFTVLNDRRRNWPLRREADRGRRDLVMPGLAVAQ